jgi:hypothetical protein
MGFFGGQEMKKEEILVLVRTRILRQKQKDAKKAESMIESSRINADVAKSIALNDNSATLIYREIYESIRQLGDAKWNMLGYEPGNHEISLDILKEMDIKEKVKLNHLERFKKIRHDANYDGFRVSVAQANEILEFWNKCGEEMINLLKSELKAGQ